LPRIALADVVTRELLIVGEESSGATCIPGGCTALLAALEAGGAFIERQSDAFLGQYRLRPEVRTAMRAELRVDDPDLDRTRRALLRGGLARHYPTLAVQLANWAFECRDWVILEHLWGTYSAGVLLADPRVRFAYAEAPEEQRSRLPGLTYGSALAAAFNPTTGNLDLDVMATALIRDGRSLHALWKQNPTAESKVSAGTLWMLAQATIPEALGDPNLDGSAITSAEVLAAAREASAGGDSVTSKTLTFFHATASMVAFLRTDWARARREAELAMILSDCAFAGFLACLMVAMSSGASGNTQYFGIAEKYLALHAQHQCRVATWIEPAFHLSWAEDAVRTLDQRLADRHLRMHEVEGAATRWFNVQPMHALVTAMYGILWDDPERALARFDSLVADGAIPFDGGEPWAALLLRWRAELLMAMGELHRADQLLVGLVDHSAAAVTAVPSARLQLWAGDYGRAIAKADEGIFSLELSLADRAHLYAIKSAALLLSDAGDDLVGAAAMGACVVSEQARTLVPFAMLPSDVRRRLLDEHRSHHPVEDCPLVAADRRGAFDALPHGRTPTATPPVRLTRREAVLLPLLATPATVQEIADQQYVSVNTVRKQVVALREKFGVSTRTELIRKAHDAGLLEARATALGG
jgi:DNA-binding NarL/FixJ family response regulator